MSALKRLRLVGEAKQLKKAWLLLAAIRGLPANILSQRELFYVPSYTNLPINEIKREIDRLELDVRSLISEQFESPAGFKTIVSWCARRHDDWLGTKSPYFDIGSLKEVEAMLGSLRRYPVLEYPPYARLLIQSFSGAGIRHPEYHLGRDLMFVWNDFLQENLKCDQLESQGQDIHTEKLQTLGRLTIITCFNLLEAFVSGLQLHWEMESKDKALAVELPKHSAPLADRFYQVVNIIAGPETRILPSRDPLLTLFGEIKHRRDSFVHCAPGIAVTKKGFRKEEYFHSIDKELVRRSVRLTQEAIQLSWQSVHNRASPAWLPFFLTSDHLALRRDAEVPPPSPIK